MSRPRINQVPVVLWGLDVLTANEVEDNGDGSCMVINHATNFKQRCYYEDSIPENYKGDNVLFSSITSLCKFLKMNTVK